MRKLKNKILLSLAQELDLYASDRNLFGIVDGFHIDIIDMVSSKLIFLRMEKREESDIKKINAIVQLYKANLGFSKAEITENNIIFTFLDSSIWKTSKETLKNAIQGIIMIAKDTGCTPSVACQHCQTISDLNFYDMSDLGIIMCDKCYQKALYDTEELKQKILNDKTNHVTAIWGSFLLGAIAIFLSILGSQLPQKLQFAIRALILGGTAWGFLLFGGKKGKETPLIILSISILQTGIAVLIKHILSVWENINSDLISAVSIVFSDPDILYSFLLELLFSMILLLFYAPILFSVISKRPIPKIELATKPHDLET